MSDPGHIYNITADWDSEAEVWYTSHSDVPGLVCEASTIDELIQILHVMVPEALNANVYGTICASFKLTAQTLQHVMMSNE